MSCSSRSRAGPGTPIWTAPMNYVTVTPLMEEIYSNQLIEESIRLEQQVAELYRVFSECIPEDSDFWEQLQREEKSHAMLIRAAKDSFVQRGKFPFDLVADSIGELKESNARIQSLIEQCKSNPPQRRKALELALSIENESGESSYAMFMDKHAVTSAEAVFQQINRQDKDHERRIRALLASLPTED